MIVACLTCESAFVRIAAATHVDVVARQVALNISGR
jgi:hypothetical protein